MKHIILHTVISSFIYYNMYRVIVGFNLSLTTMDYNIIMRPLGMREKHFTIVYMYVGASTGEIWEAKRITIQISS